MFRLLYFPLPVFKDVSKEFIWMQRANLGHPALQGDSFGTFGGFRVGGATFFPLIKRRTSADSVKLFSFTQRRLGPMVCSVMVSIRDSSAQSL